MIIFLVGLGLNRDGWKLPWGAHFNCFTFPGYLCAIGNALALFVLFCRFDGRMHRKKEEETGRREEGEEEDDTNGGIDRIAVAVCVLARFSLMMATTYLSA